MIYLRPTKFNKLRDIMSLIPQAAIGAGIKTFINSNIRKGQFETVIQDGGGSFHLADELEPASEIVLDKKYEGRHLLNLLRARTFDNHPSCYFEENGQIYEVRVSINKKNSEE